MRARFIGDPANGNDGAAEIRVWGHDFNKGQWREVTDPRFGRHSHFEFEDDDGPAAPKPPADGFAALTVPELKDLAKASGVDLGEATKRAAIIAALEAAGVEVQAPVKEGEGA